MPTLLKVVGGIAVAIVVGLIFFGWLSWPGFLSVGAGAVFGVSFLVVAASLGDDPRAADAAWRAQAGDLVGPQPRPADDEPTGSAGDAG